MEGYLFKKGRGESKLFGRKNWKKRWFILEGQYLTYFEDFDLEKKIPINKKGVAIIGGCEITSVPHQERKFCFVVKHSSRNPLFLCADKEKLMHGKAHTMATLKGEGVRDSIVYLESL